MDVEYHTKTTPNFLINYELADVKLLIHVLGAWQLRLFYSGTLISMICHFHKCWVSFVLTYLLTRLSDPAPGAVLEMAAQAAKTAIKVATAMRAQRPVASAVVPVTTGATASSCSTPTSTDIADQSIYQHCRADSGEAAMVSLPMADRNLLSRIKSGCKVEKLQLECTERLRPALAMYMIVAWRVLYLTYLGRECPDLPCDLVFDTKEWQVIHLVSTHTQAVPTKISVRISQGAAARSQLLLASSIMLRAGTRDGVHQREETR